MKKYFIMIWNILKFILIYLLFQLLTGIFMSFYYILKYYNSNLPTEQLQFLISRNLYIPMAVSSCFTLIIYILILRNKEENIIERCKFTLLNFNNTLMVILVATGAVALTSSAVNLIQYKIDSYKTVSNNISSGLNTLGGLICVIIFIPIFEEILFRGLIFIELKKTINIVVSILIQALIFGVFHGNLIQGIYTFILGVILSVIYIWLDSIWAPIICHVTYNFMGTLIFPILIYVTGKYSLIFAILGFIALLYGIFNIKSFYNNKNNSLTKSPSMD